MSRYTKGLVVLTLFYLYMMCGFARGTQCKTLKSTKGRHFIVTVPPVDNLVKDFDLEIHISSNQLGQVLVRKHNGSLPTTISNYTISQGTTKTLKLVGRLFRHDTVGRKTLALEITSTCDIAVYVASIIPNIAATYTVFPTTLASTTYILPSYKIYRDQPNILLVTGLQNNTRIELTNFESESQIFNTTIDKLETYSFQSRIDPRFSKMQSSKPVFVVVGNTCLLVDHSYTCDTVYDSPIPVELFGQSFIIPPTPPQPGSVIRVYPGTNSTSVTLLFSNSSSQSTVSFTGMREFVLGPEPTVITSSQPVNVVQYGVSTLDGDAFMTSTPATTHYSSDYVFRTPFSNKGFVYRLTITIEGNQLDGLLLDGSPVINFNKEAKWTVQSSIGNYTVMTINITDTDHKLAHRNPEVRFAALLYGYKLFFGFGLQLGFSFPVDGHDCENGGSCTSDGKCACYSGYHGDRCENAVTTTSAPSSGGVTCFDCDYTTSPLYCDSIKTCKYNEICFLERFKSSNGHVHYSSGCMDTQICNLHEQSSGIPCIHCCHGDYCNSRGCGDNGFPANNTRGPVCLDCSFASDPSECDRVTICAQNEYCHIEELQWGGNSIFHLGCKSNHECAFYSPPMSDTVVDKVQRSTPLCKVCCKDDFCNRNCTVHNHHNNIIVG